MGDRINNLFFKGDRFYCEWWVMGDRINNLFFKGDRFYSESWFLASTIYILKAIAISVSLDLWGDRIKLTIYFLKSIAITVSREF